MRRLACLSLLALASAAHAADDSFTLTGGHTDFTDGYGSRTTLGIESVDKRGANTWVFGVIGGQRRYGDGTRFDGTNMSGAFSRRWNARWSSRTSAAFSTDDPVFANRFVEQDVSWRGVQDFVLTAGARYSEYFGGADAWAWHAAGAWYRDRLTVRYRYTHHDVSTLGNSHSHLLSFRMNDRQSGGHTQLWFGTGTSLHEYDWQPIVQPGDYRSIALRRVQPLGRGVALNLDVDQSWYDTPVADYRGTGLRAGVAWRW